MFTRKFGLLAAFLIVAVGPIDGSAETVVLTPTVDNSIHKDWEDLCGAYIPTYPDLVVQSREDLPSVVRSLVLFDLSIPSEVEIVSATLRLYCLLETEYETNEFHISRITEAWNADAVTWCDRDVGSPWCSGGGCFTSNGQATIEIPTKYPDPWDGGPYEEWVEWDVTLIVQAWHTGADNNGVCVWQTPQPGHGRNQRVHFAAIDHAQAGTLGPELVVDYRDPVRGSTTTWGKVRNLFR